MSKKTTAAVLIASIAILCATGWATPSKQTKGNGSTASVGSQPSVNSLSLDPKEAILNGARAEQRLIVTGKKADGSFVDLTRTATYVSGSPGVAKIDASGLITPVSDGQAAISVRAGARSVSMKVIVKNCKQREISFLNDVLPVLDRAGCNQGACHGSQYGKGGFKLSLFGYDPEMDYEAITKLAGGRRIVRSDPGSSLILMKPTMRVSHGGGLRFSQDSFEYKTLYEWIAQGTPGPRTDDRQIVRIDLSPKERVLRKSVSGKDKQIGLQQILITAYYSDGSKADVTRMARFNSNDPNVADLSSDAPNGTVRVLTSGETAVMVRYRGKVGVCKILVPYETGIRQYPVIARNNFVDDLVIAKLQKMGIIPSELCDDYTFVRRVYLDLIGTMPTSEEIESFEADRTSDKRSKLVERLLDRLEFVDFWTLKWGDILRVNSNFTQAKGMWAFHNWIYESIINDKPYDEFAREIILGRGSTFQNGPANFYRISSKPEERAENLIQVFLGIRVQCARCHNHPFERWSQNDYHSMAAFFVRVAAKTGEDGGDQVVYIRGTGEHTNPRSKQVMVPKALAGPFYDGLTSDEDRRERLAQWMTSPDNKMFSSAIVNRLWKHFMGRGIVDPPDDMRETNPPVNEELLSRLAKDLVDHKFDLKHVMKMICTSRIYQSSSMPNATNVADEKLFSRYYIKRLSAEQLLDAISYATKSSEKFSGLPSGTRAIQLPDSRVSSYFLDVFGRPAREITCECERSDEANMAQALHLINSPSIQSKIGAAAGRVDNLVKANKTDREIVNELYLSTLCRMPEPAEVKDAVDQLLSSSTRKEGVEDLLWALINSREFIFNH